MDRFEAMSLLVASVEAGSFSAASRRLGVPLPTVSRKVAELEAHLGTRLLLRTTRRLSLTEAGTAYLAACRGILDQLEEAERAAAGEYTTPRGDLVVAAPVVFGRFHVLPVVNQFLAQYPDIDVKLVLADRNVHLVDDHVDVALRIGALPDSGLVATRVGTVTRVVCASPAYLAAHGTPQRPEELAGLPCITFESLAAGAAWLFAFPERKSVDLVPVRCRLSVNSAEGALYAAMAGIGLTQVLSYQAAPAVAGGRLRLVLRAYEREPLPINLLHAGQGLVPLKVRSFLEFAAPRLRKALAVLPV